MERMHSNARWNYGSAICGAIAWVVIVASPAWEKLAPGTIEQLFLLAPLVIVPLGLALLGAPQDPPALWAVRRMVAFMQPVAAALVVTSLAFPRGGGAAALTAAWGVVCGLLAICGMVDLPRGGWRNSSGLCRAASQLMLPVGAFGLVASRLGLTPLGFQEPIVFLTAVHFHYTVFAVPLIAALAGEAFSRSFPARVRSFAWVAAGAIAGPPIIGIGFVFSPVVKITGIGLLSASLVGLSLVLCRLLPGFRPRAAQVLLGTAAASLAAGMILACVYAAGEYTGRWFLLIPDMAWAHGILNGLGFSLCGLVAWLLASPGPVTEVASQGR